MKTILCIIPWQQQIPALTRDIEDHITVAITDRTGYTFALKHGLFPSTKGTLWIIL
jgi:hypothetical protein